MLIQINSDENILLSDELRNSYNKMMSAKLRRFNDHITRLEIHFSDEDGIRGGANDVRCMIEARVEGRKPVAVTERADTINKAVTGAIDKLKAALESLLGKMKDHYKDQRRSAPEEFETQTG